MDLATWLERHPYLGPLAALQGLVEDGPAPAPLPEPRLDAYAADYAAGIPLLASAAAGLDVLPAAVEGARALAARLSAPPAPEALRPACARLHGRLSRPDAADAVRAALAGEGGGPPETGLLRWLSWSALRPALAPALRAFDLWRCEGGWRRPICPACGARPAMAHLVPSADGRLRQLACGCCGTRWRWQRIGCPFCGNDAPARLDALEIDGEAGFRLDACGACKGYTKTWLGEGDARVPLADWTTVHLDALAREHGLVRAGPSLYAP